MLSSDTENFRLTYLALTFNLLMSIRAEPLLSINLVRIKMRSLVTAVGKHMKKTVHTMSVLEN